MLNVRISGICIDAASLFRLLIMNVMGSDIDIMEDGSIEFGNGEGAHYKGAECIFISCIGERDKEKKNGFICL
jgi:hypothetical protein